ncbi:hypothetical protein F2Q69_00057062 [Brassica cretica]|uniref:TIR domain-containing protein n=1 Tax=Brassica cretica TaxID=69181 RepID=A0A8S9MXD6_BRACR|nr:hypothetical protein F2Q69_00057062 [Brassica cretica]
MKNKNIPEEVRNAIPWIVWYLWKYRNGIIFEAKKVSASDLVVKVLEEAEFWLLAQKNEQLREKEEHEAGMVVTKSWSVPSRGCLKGNIGVDWNRVQARSGAAWVVRDDKGKSDNFQCHDPPPSTISFGDGGSALQSDLCQDPLQSDNFPCHDPPPSTISFMDGDAPLQLTSYKNPFQSDNFPCHDPAPSTISIEDGGAALQLDPCQDPFRCHDLAPPTISFGDGGAAPRDCIYLLPDSVTSSETLEQPRVSGYSITGVDPILVISCGYNQSSEERYFISYIFNELRLRGFAPLGYDLSRSPVNGNQDLLDKSQLGIIIFSMNYVSSRECMDGFVALMDHSKANELMLFPVFFEVEFCNVKDQAGSFEKAFAQFENSVQASQVLKWKAAVKELTSTDRYHQYKKG